jgi:hypothetical protein
MESAENGAAWWKQPYRIVQTNLRLTDASLNPEALAAQVRDFGATGVTFNVGGIYAWYPTELELQAVNPFLALGQDLTGEMLHAAHAAGLRMVGRFDLSKGTRIAYEAHPEWFVHNKAGEPQEYNGTFQACVNGGWAKHYGLQILEEALPRYDLDGVFFNMTGYQPYDYGNNYRGICHCRNCQDRFAEMFDRRLPEREDFSDPAYPDYLLFKKMTGGAASKAIYDTVKRLRPDTGVMGNGRGSCDFMRLELQRAVHRPAPEWPHQAGELCRWGAAKNRGMAYATASTNFLDYQWRFASETAAHHLLRVGQTIANGGQIDYYLLGLFDQDNAAPIAPMRAFMHWHRANEAHLGTTRSLARVALYHSRATELHAGATLTAKQQTNAFRGAYRVLLEGRVPFDFVSDDRMSDDEIAEQLAAYDVIVMPNVACLSDAEAAALDSFVEAGGTMVATGETGAYDERGRRRDGFALESFPAGRLSHAKNGLETYIEAETGELNLPDTHLLHLDGWYFYHEPKDDAEALLRLQPQPKYGPPELCFAELPATDNPGVLSREHGQGKVHYLPWLPEWLYFRDGLPEHRELLLQLIGEASRPEARLTGAGAVELTVRAKDDGSGGRVVHLINYVGQRGSAYEEPPALTGLRLGVQGAAGGAEALAAGGTLTFGEADDEGYAWVELPDLKHFEVVVLAGEAA